MSRPHPPWSGIKTSMERRTSGRATCPNSRGSSNSRSSGANARTLGVAAARGAARAPTATTADHREPLAVVISKTAVATPIKVRSKYHYYLLHTFIELYYIIKYLRLFFIGSYFRNDNSNYQNGYSQRSSSSNNWSASNNEGGQTGGYVSGYNKRGGPNRGPPRATDRPGGGMDRSGPRDGQRQGGQFRVGQRGAGGGNRSNNGSSTFAPRSKPQAQQQ